jgi:hypothetical protein
VSISDKKLASGIKSLSGNSKGDISFGRENSFS